MDEITYWVHTKRAPCLMNYDNLIKKQNIAVAQCSKPKSVPSCREDVPSPKKKKRKLSILDDDSMSLKEQQNVYFEASKQSQPRVVSSKSATVESDIDFNIKNSHVWGKPKRIKLQKNSKTVLHKKNKVITSTPNPKLVTAVRRSLRKTQNSNNRNSLYDNNLSEIAGLSKVKPRQQLRKSATRAKDAHLLNGTERSGMVLIKKVKNEMAVNGGGFEDLSDVSGFTANYIRSTKLRTGKTPRNLRGKEKRPHVKEITESLKKDEKLLVCVNKSVNATTDTPAAFDCSADSTNNVIVMTVKNQEKIPKNNKSTSELKFLDGKIPRNKVSNISNRVDSSKQTSKSDLHTTLQTQSSKNSRYPKRQRKYYNSTAYSSNIDLSKSLSSKKTRGNKCEFNDSDRKENPEETSISRTRSGRSIGLSLRQHDNSVLVYSNSTEHESSVPNLNVACQPTGRGRRKHKPCPKGRVQSKKAMDKCELVRKDSVREQSGFTACFSESDDEDSEPLKQRKYFC